MMKVLLVLISLILVSCGQELDSSKATIVTSPSRQGPEKPDDFTAELAIGCESGDCPDYLVKLNIRNQSSLEQCVGVHYKRNNNSYIVTSSQCVDQIYRFPDSSCQNRIQVYAQSSTPAEGIECETVVSATLNRENNPPLWSDDYFIFKLKSPLNIPSATLSRNALKSADQFEIWKIKKNGSRSYSFYKENCFPVYNSYANPFAANENSRSVIFKNCNVDEYSVGAPIVSRFGRVVGLLSVNVSRDNVPLRIPEDLLPETTLEKMVFGSTFRCRKNSKGQLPSLDCRERKRTYGELTRLRIQLKRNLDLSFYTEEVIPEELLKYRSFFKWSVDYTDNEPSLQARAIPECFFKPFSWVGRYGRRAKWIKEIKTLPFFQIHAKLDSTMQVKPSFVQTYIESEIFFNPKNVRKRGGSQVKIISGSDSRSFKYIPNCPDDESE